MGCRYMVQRIARFEKRFEKEESISIVSSVNNKLFDIDTTIGLYMVVSIIISLTVTNAVTTREDCFVFGAQIGFY